MRACRHSGSGRRSRGTRPCAAAKMAALWAVSPSTRRSSGVARAEAAKEMSLRIRGQVEDTHTGQRGQQTASASQAGLAAPGGTHLTTGASDVDATAATPRVPTPARSRPYCGTGKKEGAVSRGQHRTALTATAPLRSALAPPQRQVMLPSTGDALRRTSMTAALPPTFWRCEGKVTCKRCCFVCCVFASSHIRVWCNVSLVCLPSSYNA